MYLTFDDGPIPEVTPWVLDVLDKFQIKATFFLVGDNVRKYPHLFEDIKQRGHSWGNHTMHHLQGFKVSTRAYMRDITEADRLIDSVLFRPPHGLIRWSQAAAIKHKYNLVMYDLVTRDYSKLLTADKVIHNVKRYTRNGSIIVFHDSLKSKDKLHEALPQSIEWLMNEGYEILPLPMT